MREESSGRVVDAIRTGSCDLGVFSAHAASEGLQTRLYRRDTLMAVLPRGHALEGHASLPFSMLADQDFVGLQEGSSLQDKLADEAHAAGLHLKVRIKVQSFDAVRRMVEAELGLAVLPEGAVAPYLGAGVFTAVPLTDAWATRSLMVGFRSLDDLAAPSRRLLDCLAPDAETVRPTRYIGSA